MAARTDLEHLEARLRPVAAAAMATHRVPGLALALANAEEARFLGLGVTHQDHPLPVTRDTVFQTGSISKLFTALAACRLASRGELDLDEPVAARLGPVPLADAAAAAGVTPRHLLHHTGGFQGDYGGDTGRGRGALRRLVETLGDYPQLTPLGGAYHYSNLGFVLLGHLLAEVAGVPFEEVVAREVFRPLGLGRSGFFLEELAFERLAAGHHVGRERVLVTDWSRPRCRGPNGGVLSTAADLVAFGRFHLGDGRSADGTRLLPPAELASLFEEGPPTGVEGGARGLGWRLSSRYDLRVAFHDGATAGFRTALWLFPDHGLVMVALTNADRGARLTERLLAELRSALRGSPLPGPRQGTFAPEVAADFEGVHAGSGVLDLLREGPTGLRLRWWSGTIDDPIEATLAPAGGDRVEVAEGPYAGTQGDFLRDPEGTIHALRWNGSRLFRRFPRGAPIPGLEELASRRPELLPSLGLAPEPGERTTEDHDE